MKKNYQKTAAKLDADGLNLREALFARLYLINKGHGGQAAKDAGYQGSHSKRAKQLLDNSRVAAVIQRERARVFDQCHITVDKVLREVARIAFFDPRRLFNPDGSMIPVSGLDDDTSAVICGVVVRSSGRGTRVRFANKLQALEMLGQYLKLWDGSGNRVGDRLNEVIAAMREGPSASSIQ
jgi:phage terminase small subunit